VTEPSVTVCVPALNEELHIGACLEALEAQTYEHIVEVLVVDGGSTDRTREVAALHERVRVLNNPRRIQAAALNIALSQAKGDVFVRIDAHCVVPPEYVARCVQVLRDTGAAVVGGQMVPVGSGWLHRGIAAAMSCRVGAGPARFHVGGPRGWVDTVYLGAFWTADARRVGGYDENVLVNEDAEFAHRMRAHGGVWFEPELRVTYTPRSNLLGLAQQFYRYGRARARTAWKHPRSLRPRQIVAPALVVGLAGPWRRSITILYGAVVAAAVLNIMRRSGAAPAVGAAAAIPTMHVAWGLGFLREVVYQTIRPPRR
jgi:glycosyltransferase involved in cell wall biosynthesis